MADPLQGEVYHWPQIKKNHPMGSETIHKWVIVSRDAFNESSSHVLGCPLTSYPATAIDIEVTSCCAYPGDTWLVMGTHGGLRGSTRELHWQWVVPEEMPLRELDTLPTPDRSYNRDQLSWHEDSWRLEGDTAGAYAQFYVDLFQAIRLDGAVPITPQSVRRVIWLQEKCHELSPLPQEIS